jgi:S-adenosylmethionine hydrolase
VIRSIAPEIPILDVTHGIPRHGVRAGALALRNALPYLPVGVHVAIVDPQVGTERRAVGLRCGDGRVLIGPDNGLLYLAWERSGGAVEAVDLTRSPHRLEPVSATFHGRDVFAPVAAQIAGGAALTDAGDPIDPAELTPLRLPVASVEATRATAHALIVDRFGNVALNLEHGDLLKIGLTIGSGVEVDAPTGSHQATLVQTFADLPQGRLLLYEDAWGWVALAINRGDAAAELGLEPDAEVRIAPAQ